VASDNISVQFHELYNHRTRRKIQKCSNLRKIILLKPEIFCDSPELHSGKGLAAAPTRGDAPTWVRPQSKAMFLILVNQLSASLLRSTSHMTSQELLPYHLYGKDRFEAQVMTGFRLHKEGPFNTNVQVPYPYPYPYSTQTCSSIT
jgi:hypothetical protein